MFCGYDRTPGMQLPPDLGAWLTLASFIGVCAGAIYRKLNQIDERAAVAAATATAGLAAAALAHEKASGRIEGQDARLYRVEQVMAGLALKVEHLDEGVSGTREDLAEIKGLIIDPMKRFQELERLVAAVTAGRQAQDTQIADLKAEVKGLRDWRHDLENVRSAAVTREALAAERARQGSPGA